MKSKSSSNSQSSSLTPFLHYDMSIHPLEHLSCKVEEMDTDELKRSICTWERIAAIFGQSAYTVGPFLSLYREYNSLYDAHHCPRLKNYSVLSSLRDSLSLNMELRWFLTPATLLCLTGSITSVLRTSNQPKIMSGQLWCFFLFFIDECGGNMLTKT